MLWKAEFLLDLAVEQKLLCTWNTHTGRVQGKRANWHQL